MGTMGKGQNQASEMPPDSWPSFLKIPCLWSPLSYVPIYTAYGIPLPPSLPGHWREAAAVEGLSVQRSER